MDRTDSFQTRIDGRAATTEELASLAFAGFAHFTAMQIRDGRVRGLDLHLARLRSASIGLFGTALPDDRVRAQLRTSIESGRADLASVALSLAAMLPAIYGVKQMAKDGLGPGALAALAVGVAFGILFVRRQHRLVDPLLDMTLFRRATFTVSLVVLLLGLVAVGGTLLLVTQYFQLVRGFSALEAGLWMGPSALAMVAAGVTAPLLARRVPAGFVVAGALALSSLGYGLLATVTTQSSDLALVVAGFSLAYLGLGTIAALGTDLVVGSAPPEKAGSASAMSETVQDLGASLGIALLGSLATAIYRRAMLAGAPADLSAEARTAVSDSLWATLAMAPELPAGVVANAQTAFVAGLNGAAVASAVVVALLAVLATTTLRSVSGSH